MIQTSDLSQCEKEPIHIPGMIQPHGFSIVFHRESGVITRCSRNLSELTGFSASSWIGIPVSDILSSASVREIRRKKLSPDNARNILFNVSLPFCSRKSDILMAWSGDEIILDILPHDLQYQEHDSAVLEYMLNLMIRRITEAGSSRDFLSAAAAEFRRFTHYDRVMIYRFDSDYNGTVAAESCEEELEPYLGLHYPASDIPPQARELYLKNMTRVIKDIDYMPVGMDQSPDCRAPLDMTWSFLRSVSPVHLEYLRNMGVKATLTVSIIVNGSLWGLISCHHRTPRMISAARLNLSEIFGNILGGIIHMKEQSEYEKNKSALLSRVDSLMQILMASGSRESLFSLSPGQAELFRSLYQADGFCLKTGYRFLSSENGCPENVAELIIKNISLLTEYAPGVWYTENLRSAVPGLPEPVYSDCAGLMVHRLKNETESWLIWRRSEEIRTIEWGGNPAEKVILSEKGTISPRKSFEKFSEQIRFRSAPWTIAEKEGYQYLLPHLKRLLDFSESSTKLLRLEEEKERHYKELIEMLAGVIEQRDSYTAGHTRRVADYSAAIAQELNLPHEDIARLREAAVLHDIGKVFIPDSILLKPGRLTDQEYELIKKHLEAGCEILGKIDYYQPLAEIIRFHHEKYNGTGYPSGKKEDEIPLMSHIMIVADALDAMTTNRIYQGRKSSEQAVEELLAYRGIWYHPDVTDAAVKLCRSGRIFQGSTSQMPETDIEKERFSYFFKDQMTGLYNENYLKLILNGERYSGFGFFLLIELRGMSLFNQKYGWNRGNSVIKKAAENLLNFTNEQESIFRFHGDDFLIAFRDSEKGNVFLQSWTPMQLEGVAASVSGISPEELWALVYSRD